MNARSCGSAGREPEVVARTSSAGGQWTRFKALPEDEYAEFCEKLPHSELYRCRGCPFVHRFPSKVRRHFHYRHSVIPPFRCGHCSYRAVERGKVAKHCRSAHPSRRLVVLTRDDGDVPLSEAASELNDNDETFPRSGDGSKTCDLSSLRNITNPTVASTSYKQQMNSERANKNSAETVRAVKNKTDNRRLLSQPSSECLSSKEMTNDESIDESDDTNDYESSDEYEPPSSKKKSDISRRAQPRSETVSDGLGAAERLDTEFGTGNDDGSRSVNIEDQMSLSEAGEDPACDHIPCETIFAINRTSYRPLWRSQTPSDREDSNAGRPGSNVPTTTQIKTEPVGDDDYQSAAPRASSTQASSAPASDRRREFPVRAPATVGAVNQRHYYCVYCGLTSKWNRRDIRLHVMHVHVGIRAYSCSHCGFANSKNRAVVRSHCAKSHPGHKAVVIDNEPVFEAIDSVQDQDNLVTIAFTTSDGTPLLTVEELDEYLSAKGIRFRAPTATQKTSKESTLIPDPETIKTSEENTLTPDLETVRKIIRNSVFNHSQPHNSAEDKPEERQPQEMSRESSNSSELMRNKDQMAALSCQWKCRQCDFRDASFAQVESHIVKQHLQLQPYSCPQCHKYFSVPQEVLSHIDEDHVGTERQIISTVDKKSKYIRRNIQCISVEVESSSLSPQRESQTDDANSVQSQSGDAQHERSNSTELEPGKDITDVLHKSNEEERSKNVHNPIQTEHPEAGENSPTEKNSVTEESDPSSSRYVIFSSSQEERCVSDNVPPTLSCSSAEQKEEPRNGPHSNDEVVKSVSDVPDLQLVTTENAGDNQIAVCNEITTHHVTSHVDHVVSDALPRSLEEQGLLGDSSHTEEHTSQLNNLSVPSTTPEITAYEENSDNRRTIHAEHVNTDALSVSADEKDSLKDLPRSYEHTQQPNNAPVLSLFTSNTITNEGNKDAIPTLAEEQLLLGDSITDEHTQQFSDVFVPVSKPYTSTDGDGTFRIITHAEHTVADALPMSTTSDTRTDKRNNEVRENSRVEDITIMHVPVSVLSEEESVNKIPEEHAKQLGTTPSQPTETQPVMETLHEEKNDRHEENSDLTSNQVIDADSSSAIVQQSQPPVDANTVPRDELATAEPPESVENNFQSLSDAMSRPSNMSNEHKPSNDSTENIGDTTFSDVATSKLNSEDHQLNRNLANGNRPSSTGQEPGLRDDDGLSSDSSSSSEEEETSTWRCDDCSFVAASESLLVAHRRSRQQYRCLYCPDFLHSSVVHMRHHCLTRHPGKPISFKHTVISCSEIKSTTFSDNSSRVLASFGQSKNTQPRNAELPVETVSKPETVEPDSFSAEKSDEAYCMDLEEYSNSEESDNSEDDDWNEYEPVPKKKSKLAKKNVSKTPKDAGSSAAGPQGTIVCDLCTSYSTPNSTVMRHHVMSHLQYYPYFCPHCSVFRSVRSFPIIKHIRMKHRGNAERFECNPDPEMEKKVRTSCHRVKSSQKDHMVEEVHRDPQPPPLTQTKAANDSNFEEHEQVAAAATPVVVNKNRKILYKCKICGLKTHLRGDFRHHIMRELQYKPFK